MLSKAFDNPFSCIKLSSFAQTVVQPMPPRRDPMPEPTALEMICKFNKLKPPKFGGGTDPLAYEEWLRRMENLFEVVDCPEGSKERLATHQFEKEAEFWWETVKP